ncbi:MAG TPA: response regulator transcription factor [Candidatus Angelobacter sp.]|nr:response regulator transcription factor [Candidatus Angelobacter sp.]
MKLNPTPTPPGKLVRLALVEDVLEMRESWRKLINGLPGFHCVCTCPSGREALRVLPGIAPDVIIMDIQMPGMTGIECTLRLKELLPKIPILILTVSADTQTVFRALEAGADGYLLKRSRPDQLQTAIQDVLEGGAPMTSEIARRVVASFRQRATKRDGTTGLTPREEEVLGYLSKGFANKEIAAKMSVSYETVRDHLRNIYEKLHVHSRTEAVARYLGSSTAPGDESQ